MAYIEISNLEGGDVRIYVDEELHAIDQVLEDLVKPALMALGFHPDNVADVFCCPDLCTEVRSEEPHTYIPNQLEEWLDAKIAADVGEQDGDDEPGGGMPAEGGGHL